MIRGLRRARRSGIAAGRPWRNDCRLIIGEALGKPELRAKLKAEGRTVAQPIDSQLQANQFFDQYQLRVTQLIRGVGWKTNAA
ncbi:hypothetical protein LMG23992_04477 [Cupriavidus laharis]|uniref:Uncharacterized protein n=1 Tax=Cupriavidus laharis TaxID=151654 RepID=A0ABM8XM76_9BURK|nr:hypothetical protein [Cupriavidus laharis]CAG9181325.1 hypothetical protein LMG23992_04477 [Cupriavidus laharis]